MALEVTKIVLPSVHLMSELHCPFLRSHGSHLILTRIIHVSILQKDGSLHHNLILRRVFERGNYTKDVDKKSPRYAILKIISNLYMKHLTLY